MKKYLLSETNIYPIKSLCGISLQSSIVEERGLKKENQEELFIPFNYEHTETKDVIIWEDSVQGSFYDKSIDEWFCDSLRINCRLVYMQDSTERKVNPAKTQRRVL